ncbi:hypothetical protein WK05_13485 [Burkholderia ubonensis]|uniref:hypothetical protein n=1 Tax=Burkholderia ubonensis TaxID=101571 RepID=UPI0007556A52|nr:hypothetical protein [Burkholderia ubonensis]KVO27039.1 hypothetical protein WJ72_23405 [Burkholderia ubonensis]KVQ72283.1 hypothetical protein WK05_13485 [Burkholderia ubonensis]
MPIDAPESLLDVLCDAARGWPTYAEVRPIYDKLLAVAPQPAQAATKAAHEIVAEQQRTHEFVQFADRTRCVASIDPNAGVGPYPHPSAQADALDEEQRDALNEAICWANDDGLPGTADQLRSILALHAQADARAEARHKCHG